ncbi:MAG: hypothetical protein QOH92_1358 [Chloroflexota bacterium]|nr:hypothetical protein [Chloroflexota bacterium]
MAVVNRPNGRDAKRVAGRILNSVMRCRRLSYSKRGQAIVETALLLPLLMLLTMGSADLGRVFYYSIAVTNAAREAARQGTYFDPTANPPANTFDDYADILAAAQRDVPSDVTLALSTIAPLHCLTGSQSSWSANYPTAPNTGYVYICFDGQDNPAPASATSTIQVTILYNFQPVTPLASVVGASTVHVVSSTTMEVQHQQ